MISAIGGIALIGIGWLVLNHNMTWLASETRELFDALHLDGVLRIFER